MQREGKVGREVIGFRNAAKKCVRKGEHDLFVAVLCDGNSRRAESESERGRAGRRVPQLSVAGTRRAGGTSFKWLDSVS